MNINFTNLTKLVKPKGVIHVGANTCQELTLYLKHGIENRLWIEGNFTIANKVRDTTNENVLCAVISDNECETEIHIASNNCESTSILKPLLHSEIYPEIIFSDVQCVVPCRLERLLFMVDFRKFNYLVLDIQGAELKALKGLDIFANFFDVIITEAYTEELYLDCGKLHEIKEYLANYELVEFVPEIGKGWGDAAFIRKDLLV
jgi:hypothetical protein